MEYLFGQDYVRNYLTDIEGEVFFYGFNTTLNTSLFWIIAFTFYLILIMAKGSKIAPPNQIKYFFSQILIFGFLGIDERFLIHENIDKFFSIEDTIILFSIGILELAILYYWAGISKYPEKSRVYIFLAGGCFGIMLLIDGFLPSRLLFRLSLEDLFKTWSTFFLLLFTLEEFKKTHRGIMTH